MIRHITSGGGCVRQVRQLLRALVGFPARHPQFEQPPLREQRQRLARVFELLPVETALDEEHSAIGISRRSRGGANGIRRLAHQQRLIAGDEVKMAAKQRAKAAGN